jgi:hypothetical protein
MANLVLNVSPADFPNSPLEIEWFDYDPENHHQLSELRQTYPDTYVFKRETTEEWDRILCVPMSLESPTLGGNSDIIYTHDNLWLCTTLIRNSLINYFHSIGRTLFDFLPIKLVADGKADELLSQSIPTGVTCPEWLSIRPLFEIQVRVFNLDDRPPFVGLTLDLRTTKQVHCPCSELINQGFDPRGLYVRRRLEIRDARITPRFQLVGRVEAFTKGNLELTDAREGFDFIPADEAFLETRPDAFDRCMQHAFGSSLPRVKAELNVRTANLRNGPQRLNRLNLVLNYISKKNLELAQDVTFKLGPFLEQRDKDAVFKFPAVQQAPGAVYVFDPTGSRTSQWPVDTGMNKHGPYSQRDFITRPKVCVICQRSKKGQVEQFIRKLKEGIVNPELKSHAFEKGMLRKYHLEDLEIEFFHAEGSSSQAYKKAIQQALAKGGPQGPRWNLALVQTEDRFHQLHGDKNPYLISKAEFLAHQIPSQEFKIETANLNDYNLQYALNNISLAIYSKLNGIPWLIKADQGIAHELVIGIGSATIGESRLGESERIVGITTVFTGDGNYCISNLSRAVAFQDYQSELLSTLRLAVAQVREDINWKPRDPVRLIFHAFKPLRDAETEAVKSLMLEMGEYDVEYAFIHVVEDHPYVIFDRHQRGDGKNPARLKGVMGPTRGLFLRLSDHEVLISLTGFREVKKPEDGIPVPVLLRLHDHSTFVDTTYLARQVFTFASHSWQGYFPCDLPVSILYSRLIAKQLGQLSTLPNWNPNVMLGRVGWTRWFL